MTEKINETIENELKELTVDYPSEDEIDQTIFALYEHMPEQKKSLNLRLKQIKELIILSGKEFMHISPYFWAANIIFLLLGAGSTYFFSANPLITLFVLSPLPFLTGLLEIFKSKDKGIAELEITLKFKLEQLIFSRIFIVAGFNFILNVMMLAWLFASENIALHLTQLLVYWVMPVAAVSAIGLIVTTRLKGNFVSPILISSWLIFAFFVSQFPSLLADISIAGSVIVIIVSIAIALIQLNKIKGEDFIESHS